MTVQTATAHAYLVTFTGEDTGTEYAYELEAQVGRSLRVVAHFAWHHHMRLGLEDVDLLGARVVEVTPELAA
ncbi:hypothetical protein ACN20G_28030 (plasmid) [Streptomyces sp. BI20]|uniref:hypothetical protein n=1 Tax=Streptomyces sp. BI20 TaxID=3403460 RepID=UPI003C75FCDF